MQPRRLVFSSLVAILLASPAALAGRIAVLPPQLKPQGAVELRDRFHEAVATGLARAGEVVPPAEVRAALAREVDLQECTAGPCVTRAAALLRAERVVTVEVEIMGKDYTIRLRSFDATGHDLGAIPEEKCDICTVREATRAGERVADRAVALVEKGLSRAGAKIAPDDEDVPLRETPARPAGAEPPVPAPAPLAARPASSVEPPPPPPRPAEAPPAAVTVSAPPQQQRGHEHGPGALRIVAYTAFGVGALSLAAMIPFAVYASKEGPAGTLSSYTCSDPNPQFSCPSVYSGNTAPTVVFGVLSGAALITGAVLLAVDHRNEKRRAATVSGGPLPGGGFAASARLEF